jgi:hypothetical protein
MRTERTTLLLIYALTSRANTIVLALLVRAYINNLGGGDETSKDKNITINETVYGMRTKTIWRDNSNLVCRILLTSPEAPQQKVRQP